ncbi:nicotinate-nucleotide--dimethylbenzimidazole phosphoribosyltransferase [Mycobacteroides abscessus]|uniref:Nicotinate-nucleotide--dimethylbenzimidazole phosphoribosyltransferase n=1 Tax=Mycobacteroides abscessus subsp. abscessus TaxID=1185650 RepID=A0AB38D524_9MYCO|nr:nicotinate-nucleotide--dimethylbenzimidazole phosphoribosyltransferase [Mycobacteroides abscessus]AKP57929.1 nicotinate-nucleotide--dimethylbenzimidazole phosphoribosyltransferase [Mycobacteroides abscessus UC22]MBE5419989.1 nicotinate-nucleotide-dimethylbenzimidazole phosphoribosyltransferase [Mycobacteroides abscessus]MBE5455311.1 nicotinate-nucleotide-dimethylbenzimidazole phosphoribosyltransferase [Mycobacteroides abscessus]MBN7326412.1 nicotinate-nucleotide--dimethylbenzimidazole phosph
MTQAEPPEAPRFAPVSAPDPDIADAARARQHRLTKPTGALGRLEELSVWAAACQNRCPPTAFQRPRVVVFAGDHGVAAAGVSAYPASVTAQMVRNMDAGGAAVNVLAALTGAGVRVADMAVGRPSGNIAVEDALTGEQTHAALAAGIALADAEVDGGADLLIAGDMGIGNTTPATVLVAALTGSEPVAVVGRGTGVDDAGWMRKTAAVRDALRRTKDVRTDPVALLGVAGGADLAAMTGFLAQAAVRRTPVLLDGLVVTSAALVAEQLAPGARQWWLAGHRSTEPAHSLALQRLRLDPVLDLQMRLGEGSGALVALPVLQAAVGTLAQMATFDEARVDTA